MSQRERVSIIMIGVIFGLVMGLIYKDLFKCLLTGVIVSSVILVKQSRQVKKNHF